MTTVPSSGPISFRDIKAAMNPTESITARYLRFQYGNSYGGVGRCMNLGGVRVYSTFGGPNIIRSSMTTSSLDQHSPGFWSGNMVDNNDSTIYHSSCGSEYPWVKIDLGSEQPIYRVELTNRTDCCKSRIAGITLELRNNSDSVIFTSGLIALTDGSTIYREGEDGYLYYTFWPAINTIAYGSNVRPYPTVPTKSTVSGPIRMSDYRPSASNNHTKGVPDIKDNNLRIQDFKGKSKAVVSGLQYRVCSGYFGDDPNWFLSQQESYATGLVTNLANINTSTGGIIPLDGSLSLYSVEWMGFFFAPNTGTYTFITVSDDASYLWVGSNALSGYTTSNAIVRNGGTHPMQYASGTISLTANTFYPIRIQFGEAYGGDDCNIYFSGPNIAQTSDFTNYVFFGLGAYNTLPTPSARLLRTVTQTNTDGIYYINVNGIGTPTYCLMDSKWDGGGWMLLMKATRGTTFQYYSSYWTDANTTLNTTDLTRNNADAKYGVFNTAYIKDVMAFWPDVGQTGGSIVQSETWTWLMNNYYGGGARATAITGFSTASARNTPSYSDPLTFPGFSSAIWSYQNPDRRFVLGGVNHISSSWFQVRWGFLWNENGNFGSPDAFGGIGMAGVWGGGGANNTYSAGDYYGCCGSAGLNRTMRFEMYGR